MQYSVVGTNFNDGVLLNGALKDLLFEELTPAERMPYFAASFNKALLAKITSPLNQAVDMRRVFQQENDCCFDISQALYVFAAKTTWATANWALALE